MERETTGGPDRLAALNQNQRAAVTHKAGPLLIVAGAGTGKTRVIVHRLAYLIDQGTPADRLLALTFTNRAASELRARVEELTGDEGRGLNVGTFHWLGHRILRRYSSLLPVGNGFTLVSPREAAAIIRDAGPSVHLPGMAPSALREAISHARNGQGDAVSEPLRGAVSEYVSALRRQRALDLDDLILETTSLLMNREDVRERLRRHFAHILVDEYQDTNAAQEALLKQLVRPSGNITAVGDQDQAIYGWRYASGTNMMLFGQTFPRTTVVRLEQNYRSTQRILNAANELIRANHDRTDKRLVATKRAGSKPTILAASDERVEAETVTREIKRLRTKGVKAASIAVLYRTNAQSRTVEEALMRAGIPYEVRSGRRFYERPEVARVNDGLRLLAEAGEPNRAARLLRHVPGIGPARAGRMGLAIGPDLSLDLGLIGGTIPAAPLAAVERLLTALSNAGRMTSLGATVAAVATAIEQTCGAPGGSSVDAESARENVEEFQASAIQFAQESADADLLRAFLDRIAIAGATQEESDLAGRVQLLTLHTAKGLEFDAVFVVGIEEGLLPHRRSAGTDAEIEEERRLLYVGMTRARHYLHLSYARTRLFGDSQGAAGPSRFIDDMPGQVLTIARSEISRPTHRLASVTAGERVSHPRWGPGRVEEVQGSGGETMVAIAFDSGHSKTVQLRHAPLDRIS